MTSKVLCNENVGHVFTFQIAKKKGEHVPRSRVMGHLNSPARSGGGGRVKNCHNLKCNDKISKLDSLKL